MRPQRCCLLSKAAFARGVQRAARQRVSSPQAAKCISARGSRRPDRRSAWRTADRPRSASEPAASALQKASPSKFRAVYSHSAAAHRRSELRLECSHSGWFVPLSVLLQALSRSVKRQSRKALASVEDGLPIQENQDTNNDCQHSAYAEIPVAVTRRQFALPAIHSEGNAEFSCL